MIHVDKKHADIIYAILNKYPYTFYAFGSRVKGTQKKFSDLDLCYKEIIPSVVMARLEEEFEESNLPFKVDIVDWNRCTEEFQQKIKDDLVKITSF